MNRTEGRDPRGNKLTTADLAAAGRQPPESQERRERENERIDRPEERVDRERRAEVAQGRVEATPERERLEPLFPPDMAQTYRSRWAAVQSSFVDDPRQAAMQGDELVAQVMKSLAESFAHEREQLERQLSQSGEASTETLRVALRRYRSFFERLLSL
jgi:hypothetical protein